MTSPSPMNRGYVHFRSTSTYMNDQQSVCSWWLLEQRYVLRVFLSLRVSLVIFTLEKRRASSNPDLALSFPRTGNDLAWCDAIKSGHYFSTRRAAGNVVYQVWLPKTEDKPLFFTVDTFLIICKSIIRRMSRFRDCEVFFFTFFYSSLVYRTTQPDDLIAMKVQLLRVSRCGEKKKCHWRLRENQNPHVWVLRRRGDGGLSFGLLEVYRSEIKAHYSTPWDDTFFLIHAVTNRERTDSEWFFPIIVAPVQVIALDLICDFRLCKIRFPRNRCSA